MSMLFATFASAWNFSVGFGGLKSFGHQCFFGIGAYTSALLASRLGLSPWVTIFVGAVLASAIGAIVAIPVLKIKSMAHVAIVTLALAEIVRLFATNLRWLTNGESGLVGIPPFDPVALPGLPAVVFDSAHKVSYYYVAALALVATVAIIMGLMRSRFGLVLTAMRDAEAAAESLGAVAPRYKTAVFLLSAALVGLAGAIYAHYILVLTPTAVMGLDIMVQVLGMVLIGGMGTIYGPIIGAFGLTILVELLRDAAELRFVIYGALIMIVILLRPDGLASALPQSIRARFRR
jgi:branched-chain amino acid transport system permease protein